MSENIQHWKKEYENIPEDQTFKDIKSPENFIDDIKLKYLRPYLSQSGTVVEVGAGSGRLLTRIALENKNMTVIGIDFVVPKMMKKNIFKFNLNGESIQADAFNLPIKSNSVNILISGGVLEHFNKNEIDKIINEMYRVLKPNGLFYADIAPKKISSLRPLILNDMGGYENSFTKKQWYNILEKNNLIDIKIFSTLVLPPNFFCWFRSGLRLNIIYKLKNIIINLDNTFLSDLLGFEYFVFARKP